MNESKKRDITVHKNEAFDNGFYDYFKNRKQNKISEILNNKERNIKFETITYRELNSWEEAGLLTIEREEREWRRFSIVDGIWVKLLKELRGFGMGRKQLSVTKESLEFASKKCGVAMPFLEFYTAFAIAQKMPVIIVVFRDGLAIPISVMQYKVAKETIGMENHIQISLNDLIQGMVPELDLKEVHQPGMPMDVREMEMLAFLRMGKYEKVEIKYKNGKMDMIEGTVREITKKVNEVINEKCYEEIRIRKKDDGLVTSVVRTVKKKFEN